MFPIRQGERRLTLLLLLHNLFAVGAFTAGRSVRDAMFLAHEDRGALAWMYVASALTVALVGLVYAPLAARIRRDRMALGSALLFAGGFALFWLADRSGMRSAYHLLYVYVELMGALTLVQFWTLANELFHAREARRLYGLIGSGGMIANIVIGLLTARIATSLGATAILWLCAVLLLGCAVSALLAGRFGRQRMFARAAGKSTSGKGRARGGRDRILANGHLRAVAALTVITFFTTNIVDFQFKVIAAESYPRDQLAAFFGYFSAAIGVLALGLQLFGTGRILGRVGVIGALAILPAALGAGSLTLAFLPALWSASMVKGGDALFRYSINDATSQILYLPVAANTRAAAKGFIDGVIKPSAIGLAGLALLAYQTWFGGDPYQLAWAATALCGAWLAVVFGLRSRYVASLQDNVRNRRLDLENVAYRVRDGSTHQALERSLESGNPREVLNALEVLPYFEDVQLDNRVEALLDHVLPELRIAALDYYKQRQSVRFANSIFRRFDDPDARVRAAAVDAFCSMGKDKAIRSVKAFLGDPDPAVRSAAITGMIRYGGLDGVLMAAESLKQLIGHADPVMREHAARVLGAIGVSNFYQPLLELVADPSPSVRRAAIASAGILKSTELVIPLIYRTRSTETRRDAIEALTAFGASIVPTLKKVLGNRLEDPNMRWAVAKVLGRIGTSDAVAVLENHLDEAEEALRGQVYRSLARAVKQTRCPPGLRSRVTDALDREFLRAYGLLKAGEVLGLDRAGLLSSAITEKGLAIERRLFTLLAVLYPEAEMERIHAGIREASTEDAPRRRANAVELLDNLLSRELKRKLLPLLDDGSRSEKIEAVSGVLELSGPTRDEALMALCRDETAWVRACALHHAIELRHPGLEALLAEGLEDASPVVRELALVGYARAQPERAPFIAEKRLRDEAAVVRRQAEQIATKRLRAGQG